MFFWTDKHVLVTGGSGFTGRNVVEALRAKKCKKITALSSKECDLTQESEVARLFRETDPNIVIHLAGYVGNIASIKEKPADFFLKNLLMGTYVLHHAARKGVQKFVGAIAGCDYPVGATVPLQESSLWDGYPQKETAHYSLGKRLLHIQAQAYLAQYGLQSVILIPGNMYGPYDNFDPAHSRVIAALIRKFIEAVETGQREVTVWGTGKATRDFMYAADAAEAILLAAQHGSDADIFNLSSGVETSVRELVTALQEITAFKGKIIWETHRPEGQLRRCMDTTKARESLGFTPSVDIATGLRLTVEWYKEHGRAQHLAKGTNQ